MKTKINEELNYIKFLFDYKKGVVVSEQEAVTTPNTTIDPTTQSTQQKIEEPKKEEDPKKILDIEIRKICNSAPNKCEVCTKMFYDLQVGKLKEHAVERCLLCKEKKETDQFDCVKLKGDIMAMAVKVNTQKSTVQNQASVWVMLGSSLLSLGTQIRTLFSKEPRY